MSKIKSIWLDMGCCDENGMGAALSVDLENRSSVMIYLDSKIGEPRFADILFGRYRDTPQTDGQCVFWGNGANLSLDEIMAILKES